MPRHKIITGISLITIGILFLLINFNVLNATYLLSAVLFWPVVFLAIGLNLITRGTSLRTLGSWLLLSLLLIYAGVGVAANQMLSPTQYWQNGPLRVFADHVTLNDSGLPQDNTLVTNHVEHALPDAAKAITANVEFGMGTLTMAGTQTMVTADVSETSSTFALPTINVTEGSTTSINASADPLSLTNVLPLISGNLNWMLNINQTLPLDLTLKTGASTNHLDLHDLNLQTLNVSMGAATTDIQFGLKSGKITAAISLGAASLTLNLPQELAVRLHYQGGLTSLSLPSDLKKQPNGDYETSNYTNAKNQLDLTLHAGLGNITLQRLNAYVSSSPTQPAANSNDTPIKPPPSPDAIKFTSLRYGAHSPFDYNLGTPAVQVLNDNPTSATVNPLINFLQPTDFNTNLVLLLLQGRQATGGYRIQTTETDLHGTTLTVKVELTTPLRADMVTQVATNPYEVITVAKHLLPKTGGLSIKVIDQTGKPVASTTYQASSR